MSHRRNLSDERKVYEFLADGASIRKTAGLLKMSRSTVRDIAGRLESYGLIRKVPNTKSPIQYEAVPGTAYNPPTGDSDAEKPKNAPPVQKTPLKIEDEISKLNKIGMSTAKDRPNSKYARAHLSGIVEAQIYRVGNLEDIPDPRGVEKFGYIGYWENPDKSMPGCTLYKCNIRINGQTVKFHYRAGSKGGSLASIYPGAFWFNPLCFDSREDVIDIFCDYARVIFEILRPQGWILDKPQVKGKPHLAWPDHSLVQHFRKDYHVDGTLVCDTSTGIPEVEIEDLDDEHAWEQAQLMADLPNRFMDLESEVAEAGLEIRSHTESLAVIRSDIDQMISTIKGQQEANNTFAESTRSEITTLKESMSGVMDVLDRQGLVNVTLIQELTRLQQVSTVQLQVISNILSRHQLEDNAYVQSSEQSAPAYAADGNPTSPARLEGYQ